MTKKITPNFNSTLKKRQLKQFTITDNKKAGSDCMPLQAPPYVVQYLDKFCRSATKVPTVLKRNTVPKLQERKTSSINISPKAHLHLVIHPTKNQ
ncbi:hypothetical protein [uncultured Shewanella sp.]|uniref:hypothetical protein n=1 Tax=uncultured Shewanella sp. TaxID=173975 RepID=UPI0026107C9C|nr:hypothetical protein [uncultured Shewanella sp.]